MKKWGDEEGVPEEAEKTAQLVCSAQKGDQDAFMQLYQMYYREMYAYAAYMLRHPQDAEDAVADTVVAAFESLKKLRDVYRFRQWIFKILSNKCRKKRKQYVQRNKYQDSGREEMDGDPLKSISDGRNIEKEATDREWIRDAFDCLSEEERYIVNSFLFGGYRGEEIADSLGIGSSTLRSKYRRALMKMRKKLDE